MAENNNERSFIETMVPYVYRRSGLHLETAEEIASRTSKENQ